MNLVPVNGELVNVRGLERYTESAYEESLLVYIHAVQGADNLILKSTTSPELKYESGGAEYTIAEGVEDFRGITSVGNTLIVSDGEQIRYFIWRDDKYTELNISGAGFSMTIETDPNDEKMSAGICDELLPYDTTVYPTPDSDNRLTFSPAQLRSIYLKSDDYVNERMSKMDKPEEWHKYVTFGIAALRLYDDAYITYSDIFTLDPQINMIRSRVYNISTANGYTHGVETVLSKYKVTVDSSVVDGHIITGIDFYLTQPYSFIETNRERIVNFRSRNENLFVAMDSEAIREELSSMEFRKAYSINKEDFRNSNECSFIIPKPSGAEKELDLVDISYKSITSDKLMSYNGRLNLAGIDVNLAPMRRVQCVQKAAKPSSFTDKETSNTLWGGGYYGLVDIDNTNGDEPSIQHYEGKADIVIKVELVDTEYGSIVDWYYEENTYYPLPPILSYPSRYVEKITLYVKYKSIGYSRSIEPQHMINGNLSIFFFGQYEYVTNGLWRDDLEDEDFERVLDDAKRHSRHVGSGRNVLRYTNYGNPFHFPSVNSIQVGNGEIIGVSTSAKALSQGQFGQFPLYVFCTDGIYALEIAADGSFSATNPISRDVCNNPDSITQIDGAVVFTTDQGLMMIQGSEVVNLSEAMEGYNTDESIYFPERFFEGFDKEEFDHIVVSEKRDFREILKTCTIAYDYVNQLLRIFPKREDEKDSTHPYKYYVYSLTTREFASVVSSEFEVKNDESETYNEVKAVVPDYPSSIVQIGDALYRPSERDDNENTKKGLLLTRPIMLDEPFALKKLQDMRLHYSKFDGTSKCNVIVYVSNDGNHWMQLKSLRRKAYKYYRFAIITDMKDMDALSGMVLRYEFERTNKLR